MPLITYMYSQMAKLAAIVTGNFTPISSLTHSHEWISLHVYPPFFPLETTCAFNTGFLVRTAPTQMGYILKGNNLLLEE